MSSDEWLFIRMHSNRASPTIFCHPHHHLSPVSIEMRDALLPLRYRCLPSFSRRYRVECVILIEGIEIEVEASQCSVDVLFQTSWHELPKSAGWNSTVRKISAAKQR
jgi:hypothetical protein